MDRVQPEVRSRIMAAVRGKNTRIERLIFDELQQRRVRFLKHAAELEGRPDIVCRSCRLAVFIDGDFWHGRRYETWRHKLTPRWAAKIDANIRRDRRQRSRLRRKGWHVFRLWGSEILKDPAKSAEKVLSVKARLKTWRA